MPWDVGSPPDAAKKYSPKCQRAFVHAANSVLEKTGDDGRAIAAGHAAAKQCSGVKKAMNAVPLRSSDPDKIATFSLKIPVLKASRDAAGNPRVEGIASSTAFDRQGDVMTLRALKKMADTSVGLTIWLNHEHVVPKDIFGSVTKAWVTDSGETDEKTGQRIYDLRYAINVTKSNPAAMQTFEALDGGVSKLGLSVNGHAPDGGASVLKSIPGGRYLIDDIELDEVSIVGIPGQQRAWTYYISKSLDSTFKEEKEAILSEAPVTEPGAGDEPAAEDTGEGDAEETEDEGVQLDDKEAPRAEGEEDLPVVKSDISVWEFADGSKNVQINTGRKPKAGGNLSSQAVEDQPENEGGDDAGTEDTVIKSADTESTGAIEVVKALRGQLSAKEAENQQLRTELGESVQLIKSVMENTSKVIDALGKVPMGRKTEAKEVIKAFDDLEEQVSADLTRVLKSGIYDAEMQQLIQKG